MRCIPKTTTLRSILNHKVSRKSGFCRGPNHDRFSFWGQKDHFLEDPAFSRTQFLLRSWIRFFQVDMGICENSNTCIKSLYLETK